MALARLRGKEITLRPKMPWFPLQLFSLRCKSSRYYCKDQAKESLLAEPFGQPVAKSTSAMRILEIAIGITLLGGAVWTGVRTYRGRGTSSYFVLLFAMFLAALGLFFLFGAFSAVLREFKVSGDRIR